MCNFKLPEGDSPFLQLSPQPMGRFDRHMLLKYFSQVYASLCYFSDSINRFSLFIAAVGFGSGMSTRWPADLGGYHRALESVHFPFTC